MEKVIEIVRIKQEIKEIEKKVSVRSPEDVAEVAKQYIGDEDREVFLVFCLNTRNDVIAVHRCHVGSINSCITHPREIFKSAILNNAAAIIVAHNHPGMNPSQSSEDVQTTKRLYEAGKMLGISLLDSLIVTHNDFISLKEKGYL